MSTGPANSRSVAVLNSTEDHRSRRRKGLEAIIDTGLPPFPSTVLELMTILSDASADVKKAGKVIRADPTFSAQVLRLVNSPLLGLRTRVVGIQQAAVMLGTERLRSLAMACSLVDYTGKGLPPERITVFWEHSFLAAMLTEHLARKTDYCEKEQAYIAGLLHDIGQLPQWMLLAQEKTQRQVTLPENWPDNPGVEREYFGLDHCQIGSAMAVKWNFLPSFIDVLAHHHNPTHARHDPNLVKIVATIEHFLLAKAEYAAAAAESAAENAGQRTLHDTMAELVETNLPSFAASHSQAIVETLDKEYERLLPVVKRGLLSAIGAG